MGQENRMSRSRFRKVIALGWLFLWVPIALGVQCSQEEEYDQDMIKECLNSCYQQIRVPVQSTMTTPSCYASTPNKPGTNRQIGGCDTMEAKVQELSFDKNRDKPIVLVECIDGLLSFRDPVENIENLAVILEYSCQKEDWLTVAYKDQLDILIPLSDQQELRGIVTNILEFQPTPKKTEANRDFCSNFLCRYNRLLEFFDDLYKARKVAVADEAYRTIRVKKIKSYVTTCSKKEDLLKCQKNYRLVKAMFPEHAFTGKRYKIFDEEFTKMIEFAPDPQPVLGAKRKKKTEDKEAKKAGKDNFSNFLKSTSISDRLNKERWKDNCKESGSNESQINRIELSISDRLNEELWEGICKESGSNESQINVYLEGYGGVPKGRSYTAKDLLL